MFCDVCSAISEIEDGSMLVYVKFVYFLLEEREVLVFLKIWDWNESLRKGTVNYHTVIFHKTKLLNLATVASEMIWEKAEI